VTFGAFGETWAQRWVERFFSPSGPLDRLQVRIALLDDVLAYNDQRLTIARFAFIYLIAHRQWGPLHADKIAKFVHDQCLQIGRSSGKSTVVIEPEPAKPHPYCGACALGKGSSESREAPGKRGRGRRMAKPAGQA
jgi:hypothetical protein